jgi:hypothetical protein
MMKLKEAIEVGNNAHTFDECTEEKFRLMQDALIVLVLEMERNLDHGYMRRTAHGWYEHHQVKNEKRGRPSDIGALDSLDNLADHTSYGRGEPMPAIGCDGVKP